MISSLSQIKVGVRYELRFYRFHPAQLLRENAFVILVFIIFLALIIKDLITPGDLFGFDLSSIFSLISSINYLNPAYTAYIKLYSHKQERFRQFLIVSSINYSTDSKLCV